MSVTAILGACYPSLFYYTRPPISDFGDQLAFCAVFRLSATTAAIVQSFASRADLNRSSRCFRDRYPSLTKGTQYLDRIWSLYAGIDVCSKAADIASRKSQLYQVVVSLLAT